MALHREVPDPSSFAVYCYMQFPSIEAVKDNPRIALPREVPDPLLYAISIDRSCLR